MIKDQVLWQVYNFFWFEFWFIKAEMDKKKDKDQN